MSDSIMHRLCVILLFVLLVHVGAHDPHYMGGFMSFKFIDISNQTEYKIQLTIVTGWKLGTGPCGENCSVADIGRSTEMTRKHMLGLHGNVYFGNWTGEIGYGKRLVKYEVMTEKVSRMIQGEVGAVNMPLFWEQEIAEVELEVDPKVSYNDISFNGESWRYIDYDSKHTPSYHLQVKIKPSIRNDTGFPNNSPIAMFKPVYKILLNKMTTIRLSTIDEDDDIVRCELARFISAGGLKAMDNMTIHSDCSIDIFVNAAANTKSNWWGAVPVKISDYNRNTIQLKGEHGPRHPDNLEALSDVNVQFMVQTLDFLEEPEFVPPTKESQHEFYIYAGSTLTIPLYAKPSNGSSADIHTFYLRSIPRHTFHIPAVQADTTRSSERVKYSVVTWRTERKDAGKYVISALVTDTKGFDGLDRNYNIHIKDVILQHTTTGLQSGPYFTYMPQMNGVICMQNSTCTFPIYAATNGSGVNLTAVKYTSSTFPKTHISTPVVTTKNGKSVFNVDVTITSGLVGEQRICFQAIDSNRDVSEEKCVGVKMVEPDPCKSDPCSTGGVCQSYGSKFKCTCSFGYTGTRCETDIDECASSPCYHGATCKNGAVGLFTCQPCPPGFTGIRCETNIPDCTPNACGSAGVCVDEVEGYHCECYKGHNGSSCQIAGNNCRNHTCSQGGVCTEENLKAVCMCPLGFSDSHCQTDITTTSKMSINKKLGNTSVSFVVPTLGGGAELLCSVGTTCSIPLFLKNRFNSSSTLPSLVPWTSSPSISVKVDTPHTDKTTGINTLLSSQMSITPTKAGTTQICVEADNKGSHLDTVCYKVVSSIPGKKSHQQLFTFADPTPPDNSTILCHRGQACHVILHLPSVPHGSPLCTVKSESVFTIVFPIQSPDNGCHMDALLMPGVSEYSHICYQAGGIPKGETRCYHVNMTDKDNCVPNPCQSGGGCLNKPLETPGFTCLCKGNFTGTICEHSNPCSNAPCRHSGVCVNTNTSYHCLCPLGNTGHNCDTVPTLTTQSELTAPTFINGATFVCNLQSTCTIPVYTRGPSHTQDLVLVSGSTTLHPTLSRPKPTRISSGLFRGEIKMHPTSLGEGKICVKTTNSTPSSVQVTCYHINVTDSGKPARTYPGSFVSPTPTEGSKLPCLVGQDCHMLLYNKPTVGGQCRKILDESDEPIIKHMFTHVNATGNMCVTDILVVPDPSRGQQEICLRARETRCIKITPVISEPCTRTHCNHGACLVDHHRQTECVCDAEHRGVNCRIPAPCKSSPCKFNGFCEEDGPHYICHCSISHTGKRCGAEYVVGPDSKPSFAEPGFSNGGTFVCVKGVPCSLPVWLSVGARMSPILRVGHHNNALKVSGPVKLTKNQDLAGRKDLYHGEVTVIASKTGKEKLCLQTFNETVVMNRTRVNRLCYEISVIDAAVKTNLSKDSFVSPTPSSGSMFKCPPKQDCHFIVYSKPDGGKCPQVSVDTGKALAFPTFRDQRSFTKCLTDISVPKSSLKNTTRICLQARSNETHRCYTVEPIPDRRHKHHSSSATATTATTTMAPQMLSTTFRTFPLRHTSRTTNWFISVVTNAQSLASSHSQQSQTVAGSTASPIVLLGSSPKSLPITSHTTSSTNSHTTSPVTASVASLTTLLSTTLSATFPTTSLVTSPSTSRTALSYVSPNTSPSPATSVSSTASPTIFSAVSPKTLSMTSPSPRTVLANASHTTSSATSPPISTIVSTTASHSISPTVSTTPSPLTSRTTLPIPSTKTSPTTLPPVSPVVSSTDSPTTSSAAPPTNSPMPSPATSHKALPNASSTSSTSPPTSNSSTTSVTTLTKSSLITPSATLPTTSPIVSPAASSITSSKAASSSSPISAAVTSPSPPKISFSNSPTTSGKTLRAVSFTTSPMRATTPTSSVASLSATSPTATQALTGACSGAGVLDSGAGCHCRLGYLGAVCQFSPARYNGSRAKFAENNLMNGGTVTCDVGKPCSFPLFIQTNSLGTLPVIRTGPLPKDLNVTVGPPRSLTSETKVPELVEHTVMLKSMQNGTHHVCFRITTSSVCYRVELKRQPQSPTSSLMRKFIDPTLPAGSKIPCDQTECHLLVHATTNALSLCDNVTSRDAVVFPPVQKGSDCMTDVALSLGTVHQKQMCLHIRSGERRCYVVVKTGKQDPCLNKTCSSQGLCFRVDDAHTRCICDPTFTGVDCQSALVSLTGTPSTTNTNMTTVPAMLSTPTTTSTILESLGIDSSKPYIVEPTATNGSLIQCQVNKPCKLHVASSSGNPANGLRRPSVDGTVTPGQGGFTKDGSGHFETDVIIPSSHVTGVTQHCIGLTSTTGVQSKPWCFLVSNQLSTTGSRLNNQHFSSPTLPDGSVIMCTAGTACVIHVKTEPGHQLKEPVVTNLQHTVDSSNTTLKKIKLTLSKNDTGDHKVCIKTTDLHAARRCFIVRVLPKPVTQGLLLPVIIGPSGSNRTSLRCSLTGCELSLLVEVPRASTGEIKSVVKVGSWGGTTNLIAVSSALPNQKLLRVKIHPGPRSPNNNVVCMEVKMTSGPGSEPWCVNLKVGKSGNHLQPTPSSTGEITEPITILCHVGTTCLVPIQTPLSVPLLTPTDPKHTSVQGTVFSTNNTSLTHIIAIKPDSSQTGMHKFCLDQKMSATSSPTGKRCIQVEVLPKGWSNTNVTCYLDQDCVIPFRTTPGRVIKPTGGLVALSPIVNGNSSLYPVIFHATMPGEHTLCLPAVRYSDRSDVDNICTKINVLSPIGTQQGHHPNTPKPHIVEPSPTPWSTVQCQAGNPCTIPLVVDMGKPGSTITGVLLNHEVGNMSRPTSVGKNRLRTVVTIPEVKANLRPGMNPRCVTLKTTGGQLAPYCFYVNFNPDPRPTAISQNSTKGLQPGGSLPAGSVIQCTVGETCAIPIVEKPTDPLDPLRPVETTLSHNITSYGGGRTSITFTPTEANLGHVPVCVRTQSGSKTCYIVDVKAPHNSGVNTNLRPEIVSPIEGSTIHCQHASTCKVDLLVKTSAAFSSIQGLMRTNREGGVELLSQMPVSPHKQVLTVALHPLSPGRGTSRVCVKVTGSRRAMSNPVCLHVVYSSIATSTNASTTDVPLTTEPLEIICHQGSSCATILTTTSLRPYLEPTDKVHLRVVTDTLTTDGTHMKHEVSISLGHNTTTGEHLYCLLAKTNPYEKSSHKHCIRVIVVSPEHKCNSSRQISVKEAIAGAKSGRMICNCTDPRTRTTTTIIPPRVTNGRLMRAAGAGFGGGVATFALGGLVYVVITLLQDTSRRKSSTKVSMINLLSTPKPKANRPLKPWLTKPRN